MWGGRPLRTWLHKECQGCYKHLTNCLPIRVNCVFMPFCFFFFSSPIGRKASHHRTVRERKNGKKIPVLDRLLMMPVKQVKGKAPISRIEWRSHTRITSSHLAVTTSRLSPHEGTTMVSHHQTRIIHPAQRSTGSHRQDSPPATPISGSREVSWTDESNFVVL